MKPKKPSLKKLAASIGIDAVGCATYLIPGLGESFDLLWAPVSAALLFALYGNTAFAVVDFTEELLPGTDFIPTATINWIYESIKK